MNYINAFNKYLQNTFMSVEEEEKDTDVVSDINDNTERKEGHIYIPQDRISYMNTQKNFPKLIIDSTISFMLDILNLF